MKRKNNKKYLLLVLLLLVVSVSIGYAALATTLNLSGNSTIKKAKWDIHFENLVKKEGSKTAEVEALLEENNTTVNYTVKFSEPGEFYEFTVDVVNAGTIDAMLSEILISGLTTSQEKYIDYKVTYYDGIEFNEKDILKAGEKDSLKVRVEYRNDIKPEDLPTTNENLTLTFQITYIQDDGTGVKREKRTLLSEISKQAVLDNITSTYVTSSTGVDFSKISSDTNGKGVYILASTKDDTNPIYYYRGAVKNNNVKFAGFCWKIVRTTETGGVKLIYNGTPDSNGYCINTTGISTLIGINVFNPSYNANRYVGYMYGASSGTYAEEHANTTSSTIKTAIDNWYQTNMTAYTEKLEDTIWCNDRSLSSGSGTETSITYYGAYNRLYTNKTPSLVCSQDNDKFTVSEENGNGDLTYPVALLTADEVAYAGGVFYNSDGSSNNSTYYLYTNLAYWTLSPYGFVSVVGASEFYVRDAGYLNYYIAIDGRGVRPAVSLAPNTSFTEGDGTSNAPYIVE